MNKIIELLTCWYNANKRDLPWRRTNDPYFIWVSEIILQQTRVEQGLPYYNRFIKLFPDIESLAKAETEEILNAWKGLGYYRRALNMHQAAKMVISECNGLFPSNYHDLLKLKGIGEYTAAAIASMAFGEKTPVVDGNVVRVLSRIFMLKGDKNNAAFKRQLVEIIRPAMEIAHPGIINQALMEYGALVCIPQYPHCNDCELQYKCKAYINNCVDEYPLVSQKTIQKMLYFNYLYLSDGEKILMHLRTDDDIWKNMHELPLIQANHLLSFKELLENITFRQLNLIDPVYYGETKQFKHVLSHRIIFAKCFVFRLDDLKYSDYEVVNMKSLNKKPVSRLVEKIIEECRFKNNEQ